MSEFCCKEGVYNRECRGCSTVGCPKYHIIYNGYCSQCNEQLEYKDCKDEVSQLKMYIKYLTLTIDKEEGKFEGSFYDEFSDFNDNYIKYKNQSKWKAEYNLLKKEKEEFIKKCDRLYKSENGSGSFGMGSSTNDEK